MTLSLKSFKEEVNANALWFSEDKFQELLQEKLDALIDKQRLHGLRKHLNYHQEYYLKKKISSQEEIVRHWEKNIGINQKQR